MNRRLATGVWVSIRRGVYAEAATLYDPTLSETAARRRLHTAEIGAAFLAAGRPVGVSGKGARFLHGLPEASRAGEHVELVTQPDSGHAVRHQGFSVTPADVPRGHRTKLQGIPALAASRVAVDSLRTEDLATALMVGDAVLQRRLASLTQLEQAIYDCAGWPGIVQARQRIAWVDGRRESPLESGSFALFVEHGLPARLPLPQSQFTVTCEGRFLGRADFGWPELRVLGEADGKTKYVDDLDGAPPPEDRVWSERLRHGEFNDAGWEVARWTDHERRHSPLVVVQRVLSAAERARRLGPTG
jgi:hypothetical protein